MSNFEDQIREVIVHCGVSQYRLSEEVGVSQSVLSRFVSGQRSIDLTTLNKLAEVLGLEVLVNTQQLPRQLPRGRRPSEEMCEEVSSIVDWKRLAKSCAIEAYESRLATRRGVYAVQVRSRDLDEVLCVYNSHLYEKFPKLRDAETASFRRRIGDAGINELASASYPDAGHKNPGYSYAIILDADSKRKAMVAEVMAECVRESFRAKKG